MRKTRILVVDDVTKNLQVVGTILRNAGYEVMPTTSGLQALERVQAQLPDLILLDLMMPEMDGLEVCRRLKTDETTRQIPIIFLTASNEMEHLVKGFEAGAVDYVTKPFSPSELVARVRTHVELKQARERLREMNDEKNELMGIAAHDLRNPLGAIKGFSELALEQIEELQAHVAESGHRGLAEVTNCTRKIRDTSERMAEMVQKLLDANAIERGDIKLELKLSDLGQLLNSVVEAFLPWAASKQQKLLFEAPSESAAAWVDANSVVQIFENLVSNAIKYSPQGKSIHARVTPLTDSVRCEIRDQGPGLTLEDQKRLFGKFARLSAKPTAGERATGLGLSIVKRMVEAMNGEVWCESEPGKGAMFAVRFPRFRTGRDRE